MSVIQTIRNKYGKIAGGIIAFALVGFIISDATSGSLASFFRGRDTHVMKINGEKIDPKEYQSRLKEYETLYTMFNKGRNIDDATRAQMNEQVIQMMVYESVVDKECDKLGLQTSEEEKKELIYGANADPIVRQFQIEGNQIFNDPESNQFDPGRVKGFEKEIAEKGDKIDPTGKIREQWATVVNYVKRNSRINKFNTLFNGSVYEPTFIVKRSFNDQNSIASIKYVKVPYTTVNDNDVKVSDDDIKAYMQKHAALNKTDQPTRSIDYVSFDIVPSASDTARVLNTLADLKTAFAATKDNKTFVNGKSDEANSFSEAYFNKRTFTSRFADTIMQLPVGEIYGPYLEGGNYNLTKVVDRKTLPDSVKCRHILVKTMERGNEVLSDSLAKKRIDSAIAMIKSGVKFDSAVNLYSGDDGSKKTKGEYTFTLVDRPGISKEFGDFIFEGKVGETKVVKVKNDNYAGYHYIEILEQKGVAPAVQIAIVAKTLAPSDSTVNALYGKANEFAGKNTTAESFDAAVKKQNLNKKIGDKVKINGFTISGLGPSREVIRWMYEHKIGDVSPVFQLGEERYVVAKLTAIEDKGALAITPANRPMLEQKVKEEKKAEIIIKKFNGQTSLDAVSKAANQPVQQADTVILGGGYVPNLGFEPKVVGYAFCQSFQPNTLSPGIKGQGGVYFITVTNRTISPLPDANQGMMQMILGQQRKQQEMQLRNSMGQLLQQAVTKKADVKYNPDNF